jgi:hypothetical protein
MQVDRYRITVSAVGVDPDESAKQLASSSRSEVVAANDAQQVVNATRASAATVGGTTSEPSWSKLMKVIRFISRRRSEETK